MTTLSEAYRNAPVSSHRITPLDFDSLDGVPESHIWSQPDESQQKVQTQEPQELSIPVIDLTDPNALDLIGQACKTWGIFQVINHGLPLALIKKLESESRRLFALPTDEKLKVLRSADGATGQSYILKQQFKDSLYTTKMGFTKAMKDSKVFSLQESKVGSQEEDKGEESYTKEKADGSIFEKEIVVAYVKLKLESRRRMYHQGIGIDTIYQEGVILSLASWCKSWLVQDQTVLEQTVLEPEQAPPLPDYVPGPEHADDEIVAESDLEADPEEDDDEDPEEDLVNYPADGGDDGDDEDEPSEEDKDDDVDMEADEDEEEEEHPAPADSIVVALPAADQAPSAEETEPFETNDSQYLTPVWSDAEVTRHSRYITPPSSTPPSSPLSPWSSPLPQIPSPSLPLSPPSPVLSPAPPPSPIRSLGYRAAMIRMRAEAASTSYSLPLPPPFILSPTRPDAPSLGIPSPLPISVPTSSPPLLLPSANRRDDKPKVTLPPRKRLGIALGPGYEVGESSSAAVARPAGGLRADYGFVATMDREIRRDPEREIGYGITDS
ncbi:putative reverse transcriptase domain-containing protein [Tanacetum coccineum]|uniref:Reverse transcriptase domain-containing protein n=1 Tax=Tanacetum coccineum TaxID=301880 RepID=A0ABQ4ZMN8_9ASTR